MKKLTFLIAALLIAPPAHATGSLVCRTAGPRPVEVSVVVGHTVISSVVSARLTEKGRNVPVVLAQSWLDGSEFRLDLVDRDALLDELRLRTRKIGAFYDGSLWRSGKRHWVRCREG
jgi:hypothetical protein